MFISAVAPFQLGGGEFFASLREQLPANCRWEWVPATTQAGIAAWLQANPGYEPYSIDTSVNNGIVDYHVMAMQGPGVRTARLRFNTPLSALPSPSLPCGSSVISFAMDSSTTFAAVVQAVSSAVPTDYIAILPSAGGYIDNSIHGQMERVFSFAHWHSATGTSEFALVVNNAWCLYDIFDYPQTLQRPGYRGCPNSVGRTTLVVTSSVPECRPGSTLTFSVAPKPSGSAGFVMLGLSRMSPIDLTSFGAAQCWLIPSLDSVNPGNNLGGLTQWQMQLPSDPCLRGARFYAQGGIVDPAANALGLATSNAYMITIQ